MSRKIKSHFTLTKFTNLNYYYNLKVVQEVEQ